MPKTHLVTYGTPRFWPRILCFGLAARHFGVCDTFDWWSPRRVLQGNFRTLAPTISLSETGAGFWAWKPYLIYQTLQDVPDGDIVIYCDVGRSYPYKLLTEQMTSFERWMVSANQDFFPGVQIQEHHGPMSRFTKRDTFVLMGMDQKEVHAGPVVQASFSLWKKSPVSLRFCKEWRDLCMNRAIVGDDPSQCGCPELPDFYEHRYDQSVLSLLCFRDGAQSLLAPPGADPQDLKHPNFTGRIMDGREGSSMHTPLPLYLRLLVGSCTAVERSIRKKVRFRTEVVVPLKDAR